MRWLLLAILLALPASATVVVRQVDVLDIVSGPTTNPLGMAQSDPFRYRVTSVQGGSVLSYAGSTAVTGMLTDVRLGDVVGRATGTINNAAGGEFTFYLTPSALLDVGAYYEFRGYVYGATGVIGTVAWDPVTMGSAACSTCSAAAASVTINPTSTVTVGYTNVTIINVTNQLDNITSTIENYYTSGVSSVNGQTGPVQIVVTSGGSLSTNGTTLEIAVSGAAQSPLTNNLDGAGNVISNAAARLTGLSVGAGNSDSGANNVALVGGTTFGSGSMGNVSLGQAITFANAIINAIAAGTNITQSGGWSVAVGRELYNAGNYAVVMGYQNRNESQMSGILSGDANTNGASSIRSVIAGGHRNRIGASAPNAAILGGTNNSIAASAAGGMVIGHNSGVGSTGTYGVAIGNGVTNLNPNGTTIGGSGIWLQAPVYVDRQLAVTRTNLLLMADGVSVYTQIIIKGSTVQ